MAIDQYPYSDFHELNADWMLQTVKSSATTATSAAASAASAASAAEAAQAAAEAAAAEVEGAAEDAAAALAAATQAVTTANSASSTAQAASTVANQADATASAAAVDAAAALTAAQAASAAMTNPLTPSQLYVNPPTNLAQQMQIAYPERIYVNLGQATQGGYNVSVPSYNLIKEAMHDRIYKDIPIKAVIKTDQEGQTSNQSWFFDLKAVNRKGNLTTDLWDFYFEGNIISANSTDVLGARMGLSETAAEGLEGILIIQQT